MRLSVLRHTSFAALLGAAAIGAAVWSAPALAQSEVRIRGGIAAGAAPGQGRTGPGLALLGSADVERPGARLAARGELLFTQSSTDMRGYVGVPCFACSALVPYSRAETTEQSVGALLGAVYRVSGSAIGTRTYLLAGLGAYRSQTVFQGRASSTCQPPAGCLQIEPYEVRETKHDYGAGMHVGVGGALRLGSVDVTAEARLHVISSDVGARRQLPLVLGVRF